VVLGGTELQNETPEKREWSNHFNSPVVSGPKGVKLEKERRRQIAWELVSRFIACRQRGGEGNRNYLGCLLVQPRDEKALKTFKKARKFEKGKLRSV